MDFYIDIDKNHHYQLQNSIKTILPNCFHTLPYQHLLNRYPAPTSSQNLPSSFLNIQHINTNCQDGSNNSTMVTPFKQPYSTPSFKKLPGNTHHQKLQKYQALDLEVNSVFHPSKVDKRSTRNFWEINDKN